MNSLPRFVGFSVLLLAALAVVALTAPPWLRRQRQILHAEAISQRETQLEAALRILPPPDEGSDPAYQRQLGTLVGGTATVLKPGALPPVATPLDADFISFVHRTETSGRPYAVQVTFAVPHSAQLVAAYEKTAVATVLSGLVVLWVAAFFMLFTRRAPAAVTTRTPWDRAQSEMSSLERLAKSSATQQQALDHERATRRRAEEDARLKQGLLKQAIDARVGLGLDLHDGMIQSLYALGLTLESVRALVKTDPAEADRRLEQCRDNLNQTIRQVRDYITGLAPGPVQRTLFTQAIRAMLRELSASREVAFEIKVDDEAAALLTTEQTTETLQLAREAVSNSLRHGGASAITLRLHQSDREICLLVQDNGKGFDSNLRREGGHGLGNMHARASRIGAGLTIASRPGTGTRIVLTLPLAQSAST